MKKLLFLLLSIIATLTCICAQKSVAQKPSFSIALLNENFGLAGLKKNTPLHLGGSIAVGFTRKENEVYRATNTLELGYFNHGSVFQAAYLAWKPTFEWQFQNGLQLHGIVGMGYIHTLPTQQTYTQENGVYQTTNNNGRPGGLASLGLGLGYQFAQKSELPITLFVRHELAVIAPFDIYKALPLGINTMLKVGVTLHPF